MILQTVSKEDLKVVVVFDSVEELMAFVNRNSKAPKEEDFKRLVSFNRFYEEYGKKVTRVPSLKKWMRLSDKDIETIFKTLPAFVLSTPEVRYRPNPLTYLNQRRWEDAPVIEKKEKPKWARPATYE